MILQDHYDPEENLKYESLFCLSNGYLGTRGAYEERTAKSIPCTYINGVFDRSETFMRELANLPDWLGIKLYVEKELIGIETCRVLEYSRALDMKHSLLAKRFVLEDKKGRRTEVEGIRMVSRSNVHRMGIRLFVTPLNYSGIIEVENIIDGSVINFCDAPRFKVKHTR
ncbi:MAG: glycoside hydrolase family 65 protein, partial [Hungatella hathewayi]|nr:glycoside hydrolase family 65 protein [Hungatella hathewayi]